ncbi:PsbP-related protein [Patescibacteria group bacterium]
MNKKKIFFLVVLALCLLVVANFFTLDFSVNSMDTSNWKTYKNEKKGFEFKYPENLTIKNEEEKGVFFAEDEEYTGESLVKFLNIEFHDNEKGYSVSDACSHEGYLDNLFKTRFFKRSKACLLMYPGMIYYTHEVNFSKNGVVYSVKSDSREAYFSDVSEEILRTFKFY